MQPAAPRKYSRQTPESAKPSPALPESQPRGIFDNVAELNECEQNFLLSRNPNLAHP